MVHVGDTNFDGFRLGISIFEKCVPFLKNPTCFRVCVSWSDSEEQCTTRSGRKPVGRGRDE